MLIDWRDPASIRAWLSVAPQRHLAVMRGLWRLPAFEPFRIAMEDAAR